MKAKYLLHYKQAAMLVSLFAESDIKELKPHLNFIKAFSDSQGEVLLVKGCKLKVNLRQGKKEYFLCGYSQDRSDVLSLINNIPNLASALKVLATLGL